MEEGLAFKGKSAKINFKVVLETWATLPRYWATFLRSTAVGCWMGITPGGATPASFMSYGIARRSSKDPQSFGKGQIEGVVGARDRGPRGRHLGPAADADAGHPRFADGGRAARRSADLGPAARADALRRAKGFRLGA